MATNIGVELNLAVGKINHVSTNFISPTFNTCIKNSIETVTEVLIIRLLVPQSLILIDDA